MKKLLLSSALVCLGLASAFATKPSDKNLSKYLFVYFTGNHIEDESIHMAVSDNGFNWTALNDNKPVIDSKTISETGGVRDPHIIRRHDGKGYYMVATDMVSANGWDSNRGLVMLKSPDLVHWTASDINIQKRFPGNENLLRVWAPQTIYDESVGKYMLYWSMQHGDGPDIIYYAYANPDFTDLEDAPRQLFFPADKKSCIDADIIPHNGKYYMFYKTEGHGNGIKLAVTDSLTSGKWTEYPDYKQLTKESVEGAGVFPVAGTDKYIMMYDVYMKGGYDFVETTDLETFHPVSTPVTMDFKPRHGTIMLITPKELKKLKKNFPNTSSCKK